MLLLAPEFFSTLSVQWGNNFWPMVIVWILGALITWRVRRFHITLSYVAAFVALSALRSALPAMRFLPRLRPSQGPCTSCSFSS